MSDQRKSSKRKAKLKACFVCGDRALGYNFNAWTCESCKAFFRRNALKHKDWKCPFNDNCVITSVTRRFCQKCRLKKCFSIGMRKEFIMTEEEKRVKKLKSQTKTRKESIVSTTGSNGSSTEDNGNEVASDYLDFGNENRVNEYDQQHMQYNESQLGFQPFSFQFNSVVDDFYAELVAMETAATNGSATISSMENNSNSPPTLTTLTPIITSKSQSSKPQSAMEKIAEAEFAHTPIRANYEQTNPGHRPLNDFEQKYINDLVEASLTLKVPSTDGASCLRKPTLADIVKMTDNAIRKLISICKKVNGFKRLCEEDQIALLKGGCASLIILHLVHNYNLKTDCWTDGQDGCLLKMDVLKQARGNVYEVIRKFIESFDKKWRRDEKLMWILSAVALFSPERPNVVHHNSVKLQQQTYLFLLKRYLEATVESECTAYDNYVQLVEKLDKLRELNENVVQVMLDLDPNIIQPLLIEIFDLKSSTAETTTDVTQ